MCLLLGVLHVCNNYSVYMYVYASVLLTYIHLMLGVVLYES